MADLTAWRALVDKELAGASFDKLIQRTPEGLSLQPLYASREVEPPPPGVAPFVRGAGTRAFQLCMRVPYGGDAARELDEGADALWVDSMDRAAITTGLDRGRIVILEPDVEFERGIPSWHDHADTGSEDDDEADLDQEASGEMWSSLDWISAMVRGGQPVTVSPAQWILGKVAESELDRDPTWKYVRVTGLPFHELGADAADELALMLASLTATLRHLDDANIDLSRMAHALWAQISVGRDTFGEICKLRALRVLWHKVLTACGVPSTGLDAIHAVCSERTLSERDPWVNMLRVTTQVFAAALGGATLVTPQPFDAAFAEPGALGQRVARNTGLVLRDESQLGRVVDAAGGSYYIEARTDALAREAWSRFTAIEKDGGIVALLRAGTLHARLDAAWKLRAAAIAKRKEPVLGVSEFANLREKQPGTPKAPVGVHRDSEGFEALRARVEASPRRVTLTALGSPAEHRARVGYAEAFFAVAGVATTIDSSPSASSAGGSSAEAAAALDVVCLCGSDERYAAEAVTTARALREAGANKILLAGRPGALEPDLRAAGVDAFIFVGCDVLGTLEEVMS